MNIKRQWHFYSTKTGYSKLFINLVSLFFIFPLVDFFPVVSYLTQSIFLITILLAINTLSLPSKFIFFLRIIAATAFIASIIVFPHSPEINALTSLISYICYSLFIVTAIQAIGFRIGNEERVNRDVIRGGICLYLLLGILWYFFYAIIFLFDANAFQFPETFNSGESLFYFSFTTLTTLGYGDISPLNSFAMMFANTEALCGQLYPAIFLAKLVSLYTED
jgi:hypothetical protein